MRLWSGQYGVRKWGFILLAAADFKASVLLQSKGDKSLARIRSYFERRFAHVPENPETFHVGGEGRNSSPSPPGRHACLVSA